MSHVTKKRLLMSALALFVFTFVGIDWPITWAAVAQSGVEGAIVVAFFWLLTLLSE